MNMLSEFFDVRKDSSEIFAQLSIAENRELCGKYVQEKQEGLKPPGVIRNCRKIT